MAEESSALASIREPLGCLLRFALVLVGLGVTVSGCDELILFAGSSAEPVAHDLREIERGIEPDDGNVELGGHWRLYDHAVVSYFESDGDPSHDPGVELTHVVYPIVSDDHPHVKALREWFDLLETDASSAGPSPPAGSFTVLVRDDSFAHAGDLPDLPERSSAIHGLITTAIVRHDDDDRAVLAEAYPGIDLDTILVLHRDRERSSAGAAILTLAGGSALVLVGLLGGTALSLLRRCCGRVRTPQPR
jgi:hypothetical protein